MQRWECTTCNTRFYREVANKAVCHVCHTVLGLSKGPARRAFSLVDVGCRQCDTSLGVTFIENKASIKCFDCGFINHWDAALKDISRCIELQLEDVVKLKLLPIETFTQEEVDL